MNMKRRGFIGSLLGFLAAPRLPTTLPIKSSGIIYGPYIPITYSCIEDMLAATMSREIQKEIDREVIEAIIKKI
tara:strand:- start:28318 stop:28539 length:222 start_codon:yes stop_codon:yes gene_type:complete